MKANKIIIEFEEDMELKLEKQEQYYEVYDGNSFPIFTYSNQIMNNDNNLIGVKVNIAYENKNRNENEIAEYIQSVDSIDIQGKAYEKNNFTTREAVLDQVVLTTDQLIRIIKGVK